MLLNGKDKHTGEHKFDRVLNIYIANVELGNSPNFMI